MQVEEEKERQRQQKQLEQVQQLERERQQKKRTERKKAARLRKKETKKEVDPVVISEDLLQNGHSQPTSPKVEKFPIKKKRQHKCKCSFSCFIPFLILIWIVSASGWWASDVRNFMSSFWSDKVVSVLPALPENVTVWTKSFGETTWWLHENTGSFVRYAWLKLREAAESQQAKDLMDYTYVIVETVAKKCAELYSSLHQATVSLLDEIKKRTT